MVKSWNIVSLVTTIWSSLFLACNGQYAQNTHIGPYVLNGVQGMHRIWVPTARTTVLALSTASPAMPTLIWNCNVMPEICSNVDNWKRINPAANVVPREFTMDMNNDGRTDTRRAHMCGGTDWKHIRDDLIANPFDIHRPANIWYSIPIGPGRGQPRVMRIQNGQRLVAGAELTLIEDGLPLSGISSGLMYTCDEFPCAGWIEGGDGPNGNNRGSIMPVPQAANCAGSQYSRNGLKAESEQDWQAKGNTVLASAIREIWGPAVARSAAVVFTFTTTRIMPNNLANAATHVMVVYETAASNPTTIVKRSDGKNHFVDSAGRPITPTSDPKRALKTPSPKQNIHIDIFKRGDNGAMDGHKPDSSDSKPLIDEENEVLDDEIRALRLLKMEEKTRREDEGERILGQIELNYEETVVDASIYDPRLFKTDEYLSILDPKLFISDKKTKRANGGKEERKRLVGSDRGTWSTKEEASRIARLRKLADSAKHASSREPAAVKTARRIVRAAQREAEARNAYVVANPRRNSPNGPRGDAPIKTKRRFQRSRYEFTVNSTVAEAAALVAEADARAANTTEIIPKLKPRAPPPNASLWWYEGIEHNGQFAGAPSGYKVYRNVKDYGAKGDGVTDDTEAINAAIREGNRCQANCGATSVLGAVVYFPTGTYLVSGSLLSDYYTVFIGDPRNRPILQASNSFVGFGIFESDFYDGGPDSHEWFINQNNFYRQIRNFILDISQMPSTATSCAIHWQVAQATSLHNIRIIMAAGATNNHIGIFMENGSGGYLGDIVFERGNIGFYAGNQQFTTKNLVFSKCRTGIWSHWDWGWTWKSIYMTGVTVGLNMTRDPGGINPGSNLVLDSVFNNVQTVVLLESTTGINGTTMVVLDNVVMQNCGIGVKASGSTLLAGGSRTIASWGRGRIYNDANPDGMLSTAGMDLTPLRKIDASLLGPGSGAPGGIFERLKPQYELNNAGAFANVKNYGAFGDGVHDDTNALQRALSLNCGIDKIFIPAGTYLITKTLKVLVGCIIVGEAWPQIMATGLNFEDMKKPYVAVRVGQIGDVGDIEITDVMFTTRGPTAGAVLVEWNVKAASQGSAGMWDCVIRVGGAYGSKLQAADCPKLATSINDKCIAGSLLLRVTSRANGYFENVWGWTADHDIDSGPDQTQIDVYVARGFLIEGPGPTWLYATASEHNVLYQYQVHNARNIWMGMIQTESPYYQGVPAAPTPFEDSLGQFPMDPPFNQCNGAGDWYTCGFSWAVRLLGSTNVYLYGAGLYSWFQQYSQVCLETESCQSRALQISQSTGVHIFNLMTKASLTMVTRWNGHPAWAVDNHNAYGSTIAAWVLNQKSPIDGSGAIGPGGSYTQKIGARFWNTRRYNDYYETCPVYPCTLSLPPLTVSAPIQPTPITLTSAGATKTITPPIIRSEVLSFSPFVISSTPTNYIELIPTLSGTTIPVPAITFTTLGVKHTVIPPPLSIPFATATQYGSCSIFCDPEATEYPDYPLIVGPPIFQGSDSSNATNMTSIFGDGLLGDDNGRGCSGAGCGCTGANCGPCHGPMCGKPPGCRTGCGVDTDGGCRGTNCNSGCRDKHCGKSCKSLFCGCQGLFCGGLNFGLGGLGGLGSCFGPDCIDGLCRGGNCFPGPNDVCVPGPCPCFTCVPPGGGEGEEEEEEEDEDDEAESCPLIRLPPTVGTSNGDQTYEINAPGGSSGWKSPPEVNNGGGGSTTTGGPPEPTLDPDPFAQRFEIWARTQRTGPAFIEQWNSGTEGRNKFQRCQNALERVTMEFDVTGWPSVVSPIEHLRPWSGLQECTWTPKSGLNWETESAGAWIGDIACPTGTYPCVKPPNEDAQRELCGPNNPVTAFFQFAMIFCD
ncbi:hypothetical protein TWF102_003687 [Orbilia oligospora]|uniref:Rhodanese domain-containing protein n=1 Tax=Orbilia oligospora TaxID=2813651 RepID=A0A7C8N703_ORBOL|nr:hypothetical protein TWF102_003687 [Orbilia oligospora]